MKKLTALLLSLILTLSMMGPAMAAPEGFQDVPPDHWAWSYVDTARRNGWINGVSKTKYAPNNQVSVAQWVAMITRVAFPLNLDEAPTPNAWYADRWYASNMQLAHSRMLDYFLPETILTPQDADRPITRAEMACLTTAILDWFGLHATKEEESQILSTVPDLGEAAIQPYVRGILAPYAAGILTGVDQSKRFDGFSPVTRAQAATVLCRLYDEIERFLDPNRFLVPDFDPLPQPEPEQKPLPEPEPEPVPEDPSVPTLDPAEITAGLLAMKSSYPEGTPWTNANSYTFHGDFITGYGCAGFAFLLSDSVFGDMPVTEVHSDFDRIRPGDILRINHDTHSVVVLKVLDEDTLILAEGNYNSSIHWGRTFTRNEFIAGDSTVTTRYPL